MFEAFIQWVRRRAVVVVSSVNALILVLLVTLIALMTMDDEPDTVSAESEPVAAPAPHVSPEPAPTTEHRPAFRRTDESRRRRPSVANGRFERGGHRAEIQPGTLRRASTLRGASFRDDAATPRAARDEVPPDYQQDEIWFESLEQDDGQRGYPY